MFSCSEEVDLWSISPTFLASKQNSFCTNNFWHFVRQHHLAELHKNRVLSAKILAWNLQLNFSTHVGAASCAPFTLRSHISTFHKLVGEVRLDHSQDPITFPGFKLMSFVYIICFSERINCVSFEQEYVQPSSDMFTCVAYLLTPY